MRLRESAEVAAEHRHADQRCGREWTCQCGHCKRIRNRLRELLPATPTTGRDDEQT